MHLSSVTHKSNERIQVDGIHVDVLDWMQINSAIVCGRHF